MLECSVGFGRASYPVDASKKVRVIGAKQKENTAKGFWWWDVPTSLRSRHVQIVSLAMPNDLHAIKFPTRWVPRLLTSTQKQSRKETATEIWQLCQADHDHLFDRLIAMDQCWVYRYEPKTKEPKRTVEARELKTSQSSEAGNRIGKGDD